MVDMKGVIVIVPQVKGCDTVVSINAYNIWLREILDVW